MELWTRQMRPGRCGKERGHSRVGYGGRVVRAAVSVLQVVSVTVLVAGLLVGCSRESAPTGASDAPGTKLPPSAAPGPVGASQRTSIATASVQDITASLRANGVDDPSHWSEIIVKNEPYPASDPTQNKLRQVLSQNQADPATIAKITNALTP